MNVRLQPWAARLEWCVAAFQHGRGRRRGGLEPRHRGVWARVVGLAAGIGLLGAGSAQPALSGWRGNGTGCFPEANPPTQWEQVSQVMRGLRCQARKPSGEEGSGIPAYCGSVPEWLVLGPLPAEGEKPIDQEVLADEAKLSPDEGQKVKDATWTRCAPENGIVDFAKLFGPEAKGVSYAHTYLFAPVEGTVLFRFVHYDKLKAWLNGDLIYPRKTGSTVKLKQGWNRLLCKVNWDVQKGQYEIYPSLYHVGVLITAVMPCKTETQNVVWASRMPSSGLATPAMAGDRLFVPSEPWDLVCVSAKDGRILWVRSNSYYDALSEEERQQPQYAEIAPVVAKLNGLNAAFSTPEGPTQAMLTEKADLQKKITAFMGRTAPKRFTPPSESHGFAVGAPSTDGTNVFVWYGFGVTACYDLDGHRKWISADNHIVKHHGHNSSPILVGDRFIVHMKELMAFDTQTGKIAWRLDIGPSDALYEDHFHDSFNVFRIGTEDFLYVWGQILRVADGHRMWAGAAWREGSSIPTPVIADGVLYHMTGGGFMHKSKLPTSVEQMALVDEGKKCGQGFEVYKHIGFAASPLVHDGLIYMVDFMGRLTVVDAKTVEVVYRKDLGLGIETKTFVYQLGCCYASPIVAGKNIYVLGATGIMVVFEAGREFKLVSKNRIENVTNPGQWYELPEGFVASPVVAGNRLYLRGSENLYCIGQ